MRSETSVKFKALSLRLKVVVRTLSIAIGRNKNPMDMKKTAKVDLTKNTNGLVSMSVLEPKTNS